MTDRLDRRADRDASGRVEIRFSGSGGQGVLLAAAIVAEAAAAQGRHVVQTQSYGPEARGGSAKGEVIVSVEEIDYPEVLTPDINICLSQAAYRKYAGDTVSGGLLIYDSDLVDPAAADAAWSLRGLPFTRVATDELGRAMVANIVALGALVGLTGVLPAAAVAQAVAKRVPERFRDLNDDAFRLGLKLAEEAPPA